MKTAPFNLEAFKAGAKAVTRDGQPVKFLAHVPEAVAHHRVVFLLDGHVLTCYENGHVVSIGVYDELDLLLVVPTRSINGYEYPEPEREALVYGDVYWYPKPSGESCVDRAEWNWSNTDTMLLRRGRVHLSEESAKQHAIAEILAGGGE